MLFLVSLEKKFWQLTDTPSGVWLRATINMTEIMLLVMNENSPTSAAQEIVKRFAQVNFALLDANRWR